MEQVAGMAQLQTLSPLMQQSLNILQAPLQELRQMVDAELRENPALEEVVPETSEMPEEKGPSALESEWNEYYAQRATAEPWTKESDSRRQHLFDSAVSPPTLQGHLRAQIAAWPPADAKIAGEIIGNLDDQGYFRADVEDVAFAAGTRPLEAERVLEKVQHLDPPGVAARNLSECLLLQIERRGRKNSTEARIARHHLEELARRKLPEIARALGVPLSDVQRASAKIAKLDPRPGRAFSPEPEIVVVPELVIERDGDGCAVRLTNDGVPALKISDSYKDMLADSGREVRDYLRDKIKGGNFWIRSIQQRQQTLLNLGREIALRQRDFLDHGPSRLKPMTMGQVAEAIGVHETTVSRAASGKYIETPHGVFEIKYFFTHGYTNSAGDAVSNESVRQAIAGLLKDEDPRRPLSDQALARLPRSGRRSASRA